jgi:predicted HicB family RNase H-like nuclease
MYYKGYHAKIEYEDDDKAFHGMVIGIRDVVHFQATSVDELEKAFHESVEEYVSFCKSMNKKPEKAYSGRLVFRTTPDLHRRLATTAEMKGKSINQLLEDAAAYVAERF